MKTIFSTVVTIALIGLTDAISLRSGVDVDTQEQEGSITAFTDKKCKSGAVTNIDVLHSSYYGAYKWTTD